MSNAAAPSTTTEAMTTFYVQIVGRDERFTIQAKPSSSLKMLVSRIKTVHGKIFTSDLHKPYQVAKVVQAPLSSTSLT